MVVDDAVAGFKENLANLALTPQSTASTFQLRYNLLSPPGNILSIKFDIQTYYTGAAHPGDTSLTVNFDLDAGGPDPPRICSYRTLITSTRLPDTAPTS